MGLILAGVNSVKGALADQWKEYFTCSSLDGHTLIVKGEYHGKTSLFSGNRPSDNVISNGSGIVVADGQCVILVSQGKVVDVCAQPGQYTFDASEEPSFFVGNFSQGMKNVFSVIKERFVHGGIAAQDHRIYYINTKEIFDNKFGTNNPIPFRIVDEKIGLDLDASLRCNGSFAFRIANPVAFYENVAGNVDKKYDRTMLLEQLRAEFISALQPALGKLSSLQLRPSDLPNYVQELTSALNEQLSEKWIVNRGLEVSSVAMNPITLAEEYEEIIRNAQRVAMYTNPAMAAAALTDAQAQAMKDAANNAAGAMTGFMGMNMAQQSGGVNVNQLYQNVAEANVKFCSECGSKVKETAKFCSECGSPLEK